MTETPFMPKATAVWLVENTTLTFKQIAQFCDLHELEIKGIADGDVAKGIKAYNPILAGQLSREEIELCSKDPQRKLSLLKKLDEVEIKERKKPKYTPLSKRQDRPDAILWLCKNASELTDGHFTDELKETIASYYKRIISAHLLRGDSYEIRASANLKIGQVLTFYLFTHRSAKLHQDQSSREMYSNNRMMFH